VGIGGSQKHSNKKGNTALHAVCINGNLKLFKLLTENGARIDAQDIKGMMPIHYAII
jgi:ankyrin repeat protein